MTETSDDAGKNYLEDAVASTAFSQPSPSTPDDVGMIVEKIESETLIAKPRRRLIQAEIIEKLTDEKVIVYTLPDKIKSLADYNIAQFEYMKSSAEKEKEPVQEPCTKEKEKDNGTLTEHQTDNNYGFMRGAGYFGGKNK